MLPIIPILAAAAIVWGLTTLGWYSKLSKQQRRQADTLAMKWFGKQFQQLAERQQRKIMDHLS